MKTCFLITCFFYLLGFFVGNKVHTEKNERRGEKSFSSMQKEPEQSKVYLFKPNEKQDFFQWNSLLSYPGTAKSKTENGVFM